MHRHVSPPSSTFCPVFSQHLVFCHLLSSHWFKPVCIFFSFSISLIIINFIIICTNEKVRCTAGPLIQCDSQCTGVDRCSLRLKKELSAVICSALVQYSPAVVCVCETISHQRKIKWCLVFTYACLKEWLSNTVGKQQPKRQCWQDAEAQCTLSDVQVCRGSRRGDDGWF